MTPDLNTSATGGYLRPAYAEQNDDELADFLQEWFVGLTGLPGAMVRPRWQLDPPPQPERADDWMAFGIARRRLDFDTFIKHIPGDDSTTPATDGKTVTYRNEILEIAVRCYGPHSDAIAAAVWNNVQIGQNREPLFKNSMGLIRVLEPHQAADILKEKWIRVIDFEVHLRRAVSLQYRVLDVFGVTVEINCDGQFEDSIVMTNDGYGANGFGNIVFAPGD